MKPQSVPDVSEASRIIDAGLRVLTQEINGLGALAQTIDTTFAEVVERFFHTRGRIIVSGMGKSGHVARKIAATLASTGSPAMFVHPGEASHGDLGMITREDALLLLSNSGETAELGDLIAYSRRFDIPLVGMVRRTTSALVDAADVALILPEIPEASPVGAPTTSTTMMLALGDAIAVALLERRGFTQEDFGTFHPGGKLGKAFVRVEELMHTAEALPLVAPDTPMHEVLLEMTSKRFGCAGVVDENGHLAGIITDGDLRRGMADNLLKKRAETIMNPDPVTIRARSLAGEALRVMNERGITCLFIIDGFKPVGILHIHDLLRAGIA